MSAPGYDHVFSRWSEKQQQQHQNKKHTNLSYKATKHIERTFLNLLLLLVSRNMR